MHVLYTQCNSWVILLPRKNTLSGGLFAWLQFYWIDLACTNCPLTACRISFWFKFYECLKIAKFGSRMKSSSHDNFS